MAAGWPFSPLVRRRVLGFHADPYQHLVVVSLFPGRFSCREVWKYSERVGQAVLPLEPHGRQEPTGVVVPSDPSIRVPMPTSLIAHYDVAGEVLSAEASGCVDLPQASDLAFQYTRSIVVVRGRVASNIGCVHVAFDLGLGFQARGIVLHGLLKQADFALCVREILVLFPRVMFGTAAFPPNSALNFGRVHALGAVSPLGKNVAHLVVFILVHISLPRRSLQFSLGVSL
jgi:hypothetical protein